MKETVKRSPGRPRKEATYPVETTYVLQVTVHDPDPKALQEARERESTFVLITTLPEEGWSDAAVLHEYKEQQAVEQPAEVVAGRASVAPYELERSAQPGPVRVQGGPLSELKFLARVGSRSLRQSFA